MDHSVIEKEIKNKLNEIEKKEKVKILYAVESGSRAWGFASPDSDYDVRMIYVRPKEYYLKLEPIRDVIEWELNDIYDINGWDLQKTLRLVYKSNPTVFEWGKSNIVYKTTPYYQNVIKETEKLFSCKNGLFHYFSIAHNTYKTYFKEDNVKLKKYFYVLRPILACKWILENRKSPPILFKQLLKIENDDNIVELSDDLVEKKIDLKEVGIIPRVKELDEYIEENLLYFKNIVNNNMLNDKAADKESIYKVLDDLFLKGLE